MSKVSGVISRQVLPACGLVALFVYSALSSGQGQDNLSRGPLPPSRRRSLFTLAMSMIVFSSKEYNIDHLVQSAKAVLRRER
ncbi:hypothetical protein JHK85_054361 [Glycine max]|nr:hypothetical protein JHK85_054361 [Glycine max]